VVTNVQLYLLVGIPMLGNAIMYGIFVAFLEIKFRQMDARFEAGQRKWDESMKSWRRG
jgi:hypothetical protein